MTGASAAGAVLTAAVVALGGLAALVRAVWRLTQIVRDSMTATQANAVATRDLTVKIDHLAPIIAGRLDRLEADSAESKRRLDVIERRRG